MDTKKIALIALSNHSIARNLQCLLGAGHLFDVEQFCSFSPESCAETKYIYFPATADADGMAPDEGKAERVFGHAVANGGSQFILLSSAMIYGIGPGRQPLVNESYSTPGHDSNRIAEHWKLLESLATIRLNGKMPLTILRLCPVADAHAFPARLFSRQIAVTLPGHDPVFQFLSMQDLAGAILCVLKQAASGVYNVAPEKIVPLRSAIRAAKSVRFALPRTLQRVRRPAERLQYLRYPWTISSEKMQRELGFSPSHSSMEALLRMRNGQAQPQNGNAEFDPFGMNKDYISFFEKTLFRFLSDFYWRIEVKGMKHIPAHGPAVLTGIHRGFMPLDGVMALHTVVRGTGRYPRFLTHPALFKFPFLANFMTKLGGVVACRESADYILRSNEVLGIFPEGINGAFSHYKDAYKLQAFGRDAFVKLALRHRAPIVPFVTIGSAEIFPILGKIKSRRWTRYTDWPCIPITPTFPLLPLPLPSKWHMQVLSPISTDGYPPEAAEDRKIVRMISREVRTRMQQAIDEMLSRRRSIFFGSIFDWGEDEREQKAVVV